MDRGSVAGRRHVDQARIGLNISDELRSVLAGTDVFMTIRFGSLWRDHKIVGLAAAKSNCLNSPAPSATHCKTPGLCAIMCGRSHIETIPCAEAPHGDKPID